MRLMLFQSVFCASVAFAVCHGLREHTQMCREFRLRWSMEGDLLLIIHFLCIHANTIRMWVVAVAPMKSGSCVRAMWWKNGNIKNSFDFGFRMQKRTTDMRCVQPCCHLNWIKTMIYQNIHTTYWFMTRRPEIYGIRKPANERNTRESLAIQYQFETRLIYFAYCAQSFIVLQYSRSMKWTELFIDA